MKNLLMLAVALLGSIWIANGQQTNPTPPPRAMVDPVDRYEQTIRRNQEFLRRLEALRNIDSVNRGVNPSSQILLQDIQPIYRKLTRDESKMLAPDDDDVKKFSEFLKQSNTGITKLAPDFDCADATDVIVASPYCMKYTMPGAGTSFSFRVNNYRIRRLADLTFTENSFQSTGVLIHGILVNIGDIPLEQVSAETKGVKFLGGFAAATDYEEAIQIERQITQGIVKEGLIYRRALTAEENATYILRSIAYRGTFYRTIKNLTYNELDFDKREDILIAFRVIRKDNDGSLTILWKELESKKSPKLKKASQNKSNIKENNLVSR
jgi:hypothetical protein